MLLITKQEAFALRKICGMESVNKSHSKHPKYYLVEESKYLKALVDYRRSILSK